MKKLTPFFLVLSLLAFSSFVFADSSLDNAISWMNENWLTKFTNAQDFMSSWNLRRDEATKFFVQYAKTVLKSVPDESKTDCNKFSDLKEGWSDLSNTMKDACKLGLFNGANGKFMPKQNLTNAQALTVLIRMIDGKKDESQGHFAQKYFETAQELGIMKWLSLASTDNFDKLTTRWDIAMLLYNAVNLKTKTVLPQKIIKTTTTKKASNEIVISNEFLYTWWKIDITRKYTIYLTPWLHNFHGFYNGENAFYIALKDDYWNIIWYPVQQSASPESPLISTTNSDIYIQTWWNYTFDIHQLDNKRDIFIDNNSAFNKLFPLSIWENNYEKYSITSKYRRFFLQKWNYKVHFKYSGTSNFIVRLLDHDWIIIDYLANEIWSWDWVEPITIDNDGYYSFESEYWPMSSRKAEISPRN